jgi:hypothetical protein
MNQDELFQSLHNVNTSLTNFQKHIVGLIGQMQVEQYVMNNRTEALKEQYDLATQQLQQTLTSLRASSTALLQKLPPQAPHDDGQPTLTSPRVSKAAEAVRTAAAASGVEKPRSAARQRLADQTENLALAMLAEKVGDTFVDGLQAHRAGQLQEQAAEELDQPTLARHPANAEAQAAEEEIQRNDVAAMDPAKLEQIKNKLLDLLYTKRGVLAKWFSNEAYSGGRGPFKPEFDMNLYNQDIGKLPYQRLMSWPEGFYTNMATKAYQFLLKTDAVVAVIDFGQLASLDVMEQQQSVQLMFHTDAAHNHRRYPACNLEANLLQQVISDLDTTFTKRATAKPQPI